MAATFVGAFFIFKEYFWINLKYAVSISFVYLISGLLIVTFLEYFLVKLDLLKEAKKQTKLLEEIKNRS